MTYKLYDETNPISIESYAQRLIGLTFSDVLMMDSKYPEWTRETGSYGEEHEDKKRKGGLGELIEECFFHYKCNNESKPDFDKAGVELKVTPYKKLSNGTLSAKERLSITMIDYMEDIKQDFYESHLWGKSKLILLVYYLYLMEITNRLDYQINYARLFTPPPEDLEIIKHDYDTIISKIKAGKAHELSEGDTLYLGAATKSSSSSNRTRQPFSDIPAKPRAYSFKNSYMTYVLNKFIVPGKITFEPILKEITNDFEKYVTSKIAEYRNWSIEELCKTFEISYKKKPKNLAAMIAFRILGIKGNHAEEFEKANIVIKTIRINTNNTITEKMSFPAFKFKELINETWEDSTFGNYLSDTRFLFVVYKYDKDDILHLKGCQFWNIPYNDLHQDVRVVWDKTIDVIQSGIKVTSKNGKNYNNLPKSSESRVCHVRPHGQDSNDTYELPTGGSFTKQSFWLNNSYIISQLNPAFFE